MRKMFFRIALLTALVGTMMPLAAQITYTQKGAVDENARAILKKATDKMSSGAVSFDVTAVMRDENKRETSRTTVQVLYKAPQYRIVEGNKQEVCCDGQAVWFWTSASNEVVINKVDEGSESILNPAVLLANYQKHYKAKFIRQEDDGTAVVDLTPLKVKSYHKIRLLINANSGQLKRVEVHKYDGSREEYDIQKFKSGVKATDTDFRFNAQKHPGAQEVDMR